MLIDRAGAERGDVGPMAALGQSNWVMRRQRSLWSAIIGPQVMCCRERRLEWRLTTRVFDFVAVGGVGIVDVEV